MDISTGAVLVGVLGFAYGISAPWWSKRPHGGRIGAIGAVALLVLAIGLIVVPWLMGASW
ncbi:MAG: hypothetical protein Q4G51_02570 [Dermatophilus congolensis]|nr:hypothetical protein [Dermatophilus congolensis]